MRVLADLIEWNYHNENGYDEHIEGGHTRCCNARPQTCPTDGAALVCVEDYYGGGSHYWWLACRTCDCDFAYDTYRFALEPMTARPRPKSVYPPYATMMQKSA